MSELVNVVVAVAVIFFVVRWATSSTRESPEERRIRTALGFRPKSVTPEMAETIASMFPDMPRENIHYDLLRTGSVEQTTNKIIERGYLDPPPPAYFRVYPRADASRRQTPQPSRPGSTAPTADAQPRASSSSSSSTSFVKSGPSLIERYHLQDRLSPPDSSGEGVVAIDTPEKAGGKSAWEATPDRREASLRERKAQMVLAARKRLLEQQKAAEAAVGNGASGQSASELKTE